jgi:hypothetical protein
MMKEEKSKSVLGKDEVAPVVEAVAV